jgi:late competence protein required for DNA uptake (superfamily II DNA/RNA helicase)
MFAMNYTFHILLCGVLLLVTVALYIYRHWLENHGDHYIHLHNDSHDSAVISSQAAMCKRCETVDKIKYATLTATILYAVAIAGMAAYQAWNQPGI